MTESLKLRNIYVVCSAMRMLIYYELSRKISISAVIKPIKGKKTWFNLCQSSLKYVNSRSQNLLEIYYLFWLEVMTESFSKWTNIDSYQKNNIVSGRNLTSDNKFSREGEFYWFHKHRPIIVRHYLSLAILNWIAPLSQRGEKQGFNSIHETRKHSNLMGNVEGKNSPSRSTRKWSKVGKI